MKFHEALGAVIREERLGQEVSLREIAKAGFVSMGHLSDVENGRKEGSSAFIEAVAKALGVPTYELVIEAGYRMAEIKIPDTYEDFIDDHSPIHTTAH
jgi:transcriptional regulator with XRE-family HTH domain